MPPAPPRVLEPRPAPPEPERPSVSFLEGGGGGRVGVVPSKMSLPLYRPVNSWSRSSANSCPPPSGTEPPDSTLRFNAPREAWSSVRERAHMVQRPRGVTRYHGEEQSGVEHFNEGSDAVMGDASATRHSLDTWRTRERRTVRALPI